MSLFCSLATPTALGEPITPTVGPATTDSSSMSCIPSDVASLPGSTDVPICKAFCPASVAISLPTRPPKYLPPVLACAANDCLFISTIF